MEHDVGAFSGLTWAELEERFPEALREFNETRSFDVIEDAETHDEITARAQRVIDDLIRKHDNSDRILIFSHGGILTHVINQLLGANRLWLLSIRNTAIFEFTFDVDIWHADDRTAVNGGQWHIHRFNDASHLDGDETR